MTSIRHPPVGLFRPTKFDHALLLNRRAFIAIVAAEFVISPVNGAAQPLLVGGRPVAIEVRAQAITAFSPREPSRREFGRLTFRGGLVLTSSYRGFGGISAIRVAADGADFIALTVGRVRGSTSKRSVPSGNGPGRCGMWAFAPWPVAQHARSTCSKQGRPSQANRGPKNQGRSAVQGGPQL